MWQLQIEDDTFLQRSSGSRQAGFGKLSSVAHYIHDLASAKILIYHRQLSNNGEAIVYFFKCLSRVLGGHELSWQKEKIILIERLSAIDIFGDYVNKQASYFLSYTSYALACGVKDPKCLEGYGKHKLIRFREPPMIASGDTVQEEKHVEVAENKDTPPRQATEANIDKHTSSQQGRKRVH